MNPFKRTQDQAVQKFLTVCKFCQAPIAKAPSLDIPIVGDPGERTRKLQSVLGKHIMDKHPEQFTQGLAFMDEILSFLVFNAFEYEDPTIAPRLERIRAEIFAQVRKNTFEDSMLQHLVVGFGLDPQEEKDVTAALRAVRDACCEVGQYAPAAINSPAQPSPLIVPA